MPELYKKLKSLAESDLYPFHMPGHKRNEDAAPFGKIFNVDITEIDDFDNLHDAEGIILDAQHRANDLYKADETFFLVNGSTSGVLAAVSAVCNENDTLLTARNCHKSLYHAAYLNKIRLNYFYPEYLTEYGIYGAVSLDVIKSSVTEDTKAVFITSPTYEGIVSDIRSIAEYLHSKGIPLIVDEAHGAHFGMHKDLPAGAIEMGADIVIHSVHKTLAAMTQTALIHVQGDLVDRDRLRRYLRIYQSSSPSYVLMASIDNAIDEISTNGNNIFGKLLEYNKMILDKTSDCRYIKILDNTIIDDPGKIVISVKGTNMSGMELYDVLRLKYHLQLEMAGDTFGLAIITGYDSKEGIMRLIEAVINIDNRLEAVTDTDNKSSDIEKNISTVPQKAIEFYKAWDMNSKIIEINEAEGKIAAEFINLYPPGIPLIVPGEVINKRLIDNINGYYKKGMNLQGIIEFNSSQIAIKTVL